MENGTLAKDHNKKAQRTHKKMLQLAHRPFGKKANIYLKQTYMNVKLIEIEGIIGQENNALQTFNLAKEFPEAGQDLEKNPDKLIVYVVNCQNCLFDFSKYRFSKVMFEQCQSCEVYLGPTRGGSEFISCNYTTTHLLSEGMHNISTMLEKCKFFSLVLHFNLRQLTDFRLLGVNLFATKVMFQQEAINRYGEVEELTPIKPFVGTGNELLYKTIQMDEIKSKDRYVEISLKDLKSFLVNNSFQKKFLHPSSIESFGDLTIHTIEQ